MARYTVELRDVIRVAETQAHGSYTEFQYTEATWRAVGLDSYPIFEESHRAKLNSMICDHFYMREIGAETVALFRLFVRRTMNEIMPYYNELYLAATKLTDPLNEIDMSYTEGWGEDSTSDSTSNSQSSGNVGTESSSNSIFSDTPMSMVQDDGGTLIENGNYATNATYDKSSTDQTSQSSNDVTSNRKDTSAGSRDRTETGHRTSQAELVSQWRRAILNVDREIVESPELSECFLAILG